VRRVGAGIFIALLAVTACSADDGGEAPATTESTAFGRAMAEQSTEGATTTATSPSGGLTVETVSTRADAITGGDVLLRLSGPAAEREHVISVDGVATDAVLVPEAAFPPRDDVVTLTDDDDEAPLVGLLTDLEEGDHLVEATSGGQTAAMAITDHPLTGPVFAGDHLHPWICHTEEAGLGPAEDEHCTVEPQASVEAVTTADGGTARIRTERGVIDRGIYSLWTPADMADWNGRLVYRFGGGCGTTFGQGFDLGSGVDAALIARGYAMATNTLDTFQTICNPMVSAEAALMTRERFVEEFGVPEFTIGDGGSGGAIQQLLIAQNQPGLLDALSPAAPFPDALSIAAGVSDCGLLVQYYETPDGAALSEAQRAAVNGHLTSGTCASWNELFVGGIDPTDGCDPAIPADEVYSPDNPDGVRCTLQDSNVAVFGTDPDTGFANRVLSSEGVQYGLEAFAAGTIDAEQFVSLNEGIGGYDIDGNRVDERTAISDDLAALGYESGAITGEGPLQDIPIILRSPYTDPFGDIHTRYHAFSIRERLRVDGMDDPNLALWTTAAGGGDLVGALTGDVGGDDPIALLDEWLTTGERPAAVTNRCLLADGTELTGGWELYDETGRCRREFPVLGDPRVAAGGPVAGDVLACTLGPIEEVDAELDLTDDQLERLSAVFPDGVCDWTLPGRGQQPPSVTWPDLS
jgi:hypothetical protein